MEHKARFILEKTSFSELCIPSGILTFLVRRLDPFGTNFHKRCYLDFSKVNFNFLVGMKRLTIAFLLHGSGKFLQAATFFPPIFLLFFLPRIFYPRKEKGEYTLFSYYPDEVRGKRSCVVHLYHNLLFGSCTMIQRMM